MLTLIRRTVIPVLGEQPSGASVSMKGCSEDEGQKDKCGERGTLPRHLRGLRWVAVRGSSLPY